MRAYLLGLFTLPTLAVAALLLMRMTFAALVALERRGLGVEVRWRRHPDRVSDYTLRHDIWWERSFGPVYAGGWYRTQAIYQGPDEARVTRWLGLGSRFGPTVMFFRRRHLGPVA